MERSSEPRGLYAIVDPELCRGRDPLGVAEQVLRGGCALLQLRSKRLPPAAHEALASRMLAACRSHGVPFVINDDPQLAQRVGASGVHLGQGDMPIEQARVLPGKRLVIGLSTHSLAQAGDAAQRGADLIGFGPVFATTSKENPDPVVGVSGLRAACAAVAIPVVAIGGITLENAAQVVAAGAAYGAAISAICGAPDPEAAAARLHAALLRTR